MCVSMHVCVCLYVMEYWRVGILRGMSRGGKARKIKGELHVCGKPLSLRCVQLLPKVLGALI